MSLFDLDPCFFFFPYKKRYEKFRCNILKLFGDFLNSYEIRLFAHDPTISPNLVGGVENKVFKIKILCKISGEASRIRSRVIKFYFHWKKKNSANFLC